MKTLVYKNSIILNFSFVELVYIGMMYKSNILPSDVVYKPY